MEKIVFDNNSTKRYRNILRHGLELKWIKLPHSPDFNDNFYHEGLISRFYQIIIGFSLLDIRKRIKQFHGIRKMVI